MIHELKSLHELEQVQPQFVETLASARHVLVASHLNPDGDAIGSSLAISFFLDQLGVSHEVLNHDPVPDNLLFLPGTDRVRQAPENPDADLAIVLDLDEPSRMGRVAPYLEAADRMIVVDHHVPKVRPGQMRIVMEEAPATAAILADLLIPTGKVNAQVADNLLAGILTDTGNFRFPNTTPHCLNLAAQLIELGANLPNMAEQIYHCMPLPALRLLGWAITNLKATPNEDLVYVSLPLSVYQELGAREQDTEGIVNELLSTRHARIAFVLRERKPGVIRGSLRSRGNLDVAAIANQFGGGGHRNAAGVTFEGSLQDAEAQLAEAAQACLASSS